MLSLDFLGYLFEVFVNISNILLRHTDVIHIRPWAEVLLKSAYYAKNHSYKKYLTYHSIRFWVFLSKIVKYDLWLFQLFLVFSKSLYHELSGYVSNISIVCHTLLQEVQEHSPFCSFSWKFRFLLLAQVGKQVQNFTGGPRGIQIQLFLHKIGSTNMLIIHFQKKLGAIKV